MLNTYGNLRESRSRLQEVVTAATKQSYNCLCVCTYTHTSVQAAGLYLMFRTTAVEQPAQAACGAQKVPTPALKACHDESSRGLPRLG